MYSFTKSFDPGGRRRNEIHENNRTQPSLDYQVCDYFVSFLLFSQSPCIFIIPTASKTEKDKGRQFCILLL